MSDYSQRQLHDVVRSWIQFALGDLRDAESLLRLDVSAPRNVCYLAQQAAEKAIEAVVVF